MCEKDYIQNPAKYNCGNGKYLTNIINHSVSTCDEIKTKTFPIKIVQQKVLQQISIF